MFEGGVPEQLRRFIASPPQAPPPATAARALPFPLSFPSLETTSHHFLNPILLNNSHNKIIHHHEIKDGGSTSGWVGPTDNHQNCLADHDDDGDVTHHHQHPWSSDEVLALLRLRSTMENWFHISRKLTEIGFKRTPQECKATFEEEERKYFNNNPNNSNNHINNYNHNNKGNYRMFSELEELYHHGHHHHDHVSSEVGNIEIKKQRSLEEPRSQEKDKMGKDLEEDPREITGGREEEINPSKEAKSGNMKNDEIKLSPPTKQSSSSSSPESSEMMMMTMERNKKKGKRKRFEMLKVFCEGFVKNMIAQQEEMHKKLLEDMVKRDEEKIAREEAWKKQEMERISKDLELRAHEQALASDRHATIIKFITKFTSLSETYHRHHRQLANKVQSPSTSRSSSSLVLPQNPSDNIPTLPIESPKSAPKQAPTSSSSQTLTPQNPNSLPTHDKSFELISAPTLELKIQNPKPSNNDEKGDLGKRWPRDEVLALINIRCSTTTNNGDHHNSHQVHKDEPSSSSLKALPLWERISKKMLEMGYKRSAKRCKEKWENINKYFRKTKDVNKKRPLDSRTCPYFHQLSTLYSQGSLSTAPAAGEGASDDPETRPDETLVGSLKEGSADDPTTHVADAVGDEKRIFQVPGFNFEIS